MSELANIKSAQDNLEDMFKKRMDELEAQLHGGSAKDTVAKVAEEFRAFRELMFGMLSLLRKQITECSQSIDVIETRHRRKALLFLGVPEAEKEDCKASVSKLLEKMELATFTTDSIRVCHRIGAHSNGHHRPILVWFSGIEQRSAVWRNKTKLKGTSVSVKEFLTKNRQAIFSRARLHFGMRSCWTQDGVIVVKAVDGTRHKITTTEELNRLLQKYPKRNDSTSLGKSAVVSSAGTSSTTSKTRK